MKKENNRYFIIAEYIIVLFVYSIIVFWIFDKRTSNFWVAYLFAVLTFAIQVIGLLIFPNEETTSRIAFMGISIKVYSSVYLLIQMVISIIFMKLAMISVNTVIIIETIILAVYAAIIIACFAGMNHAGTLLEEVTRKKGYINELQNILLDAADSTKDKNLKKELKKLAEDVKYSDPISHETLELLECSLKELALDIRDNVGNMENQIITGKAEQFKNLLKERNRECMRLKQ